MNDTAYNPLENIVKAMEQAQKLQAELLEHNNSMSITAIGLLSARIELLEMRLERMAKKLELV
jgi:hypothetical protein